MVSLRAGKSLVESSPASLGSKLKLNPLDVSPNVSRVRSKSGNGLIAGTAGCEK